MGWAQQDCLGVVGDKFCHTNNKQLIERFLGLSHGLDKLVTTH